MDLFNNKEKKQEKVSKSLKFLLDDSVIDFYNKTQGLIKYHGDILDLDQVKDELYCLYLIKKHYESHLNDCKLKMRNSNNTEEYKKAIAADEMFLEKFNSDYINTYAKVLNNIVIVNNNKDLLDDTQIALIEKFNSIYGKNTDEPMMKK